MLKNIGFYSPKFESEKCYCSNVSQIVIRDYSSCEDIFALDFQRYLKNAIKFSDVSFIVYIHNIRLKQPNVNKPKVYFDFKGTRCLGSVELVFEKGL